MSPRRKRQSGQRILPGDLDILDPCHKTLLTVRYGAGVDSTAMLVMLARHGIRPDLLTFADPGNEHPETYQYLAVMNRWLAAQDFPLITLVRYAPETFTKEGYTTLEESSLDLSCLPSVCYFRKSCSLKWKASPLMGCTP